MSRKHWEIIKSIIETKQVSITVIFCVLRHSIVFQKRVAEQIDKLYNDRDNKDILFDQYQRYHTVANVIKQLMKQIENQNPMVLEVGANIQMNLGRELPTAEIYYTDLQKPIDFYYDNHCFEANATNLVRIKDNAYDFVIATDVFEHIDSSAREAFINEIFRVSRYGVILCFPFKEDAVESAEREVNERYKKVFGINHRWLIEHIENELPERKQFEQLLSSKKINFKAFEHGEIELWEKLTTLEIYMGISVELNELIKNIFEYYNTSIYGYDVGDKNYRVFYLLCKNVDLSEDDLKCLLERNDTIKEERLEIVNQAYAAIMAQVQGNIV